MGIILYVCLTVISELYLLLTVYAAAPVCSPSSYSVSVGINTTTGTTLTSLTCTDADVGETITYSIDSTSDGYTYFSMTGANVVLANRLDVEYGLVTWTVWVLAVDDNVTPTTGTATVSFTTFQSTTTTTTTPAPPGYSWFDAQANVILLGVVAGLTAFITGFCVLMCFRFHRIGTCLPSSFPEYGQCRASFTRQCDCCPIPCDFYAAEKDEPLVGESRPSRHMIPLPEPITTQQLFIPKEPSQLLDEYIPDQPPERSHVVTPVVMGNLNLSDVGFDGMRSPGFNAPMFTQYGGTRDHPPPRF